MSKALRHLSYVWRGRFRSAKAPADPPQPWRRRSGPRQPGEQRIGNLTDEHSIGRTQVDVQRPTPGRIERCEIAASLRELQCSERESLARNRDVDAWRRGDEHEHACVGTAFRELTGRVEISRAISEHRRRTRVIANGGAKRVERIRQFRTGTG